jgi:uncharacterized protein YjbI with pentapeptide repeats
MATEADKASLRAAFGDHLRELADQAGLTPSQIQVLLNHKKITAPKGTFSAWWNGQSTPHNQDVAHALEVVFNDHGVPYEQIHLVALYQAANQRALRDPADQQDPPSGAIDPDPAPAAAGQPQPPQSLSVSEPAPLRPRARWRLVGWLAIGLVTVLVIGTAAAWWRSTSTSGTEFQRTLGQLDSPDATIRQRAVGAIQDLAPRSPARRSPACGALVALIRNHQHLPHADPPMSKVPSLSERSPDTQAAVQAISHLGCVDQPEGVHLNEVDLRKAELSHSSLPGAAITWSDLRQATLVGTRLEAARLIGSNLDYANLEQARLADAELCGARMEGVHLRGANLHGADLSVELTTGRRVELAGADLTGADLRGADLRGVDLSGGGPIPSATLRGAHLEGTQLTGAKLDGVTLDGATADVATRWPAGFDPAAAGVQLGR